MSTDTLPACLVGAWCGPQVRDGAKRLVTIKEGDPRGRHVVIVDDLVQSGGTLIECHNVLAHMGAKHGACKRGAGEGAAGMASSGKRDLVHGCAGDSSDRLRVALSICLCSVRIRHTRRVPQLQLDEVQGRHWR